MNTAGSKPAAGESRPHFKMAPVGGASAGVRLGLWLALIVALPCALAFAQSSSQQTPTGQLSNHPLRPDPSNLDPDSNGDAGDSAFRQRRLSQLVAAKHKSIVSNTEKLLKLVTELNAEIGSTTPASLTPDQLRKVAAIEKLAHSVKDEMKTPVQAAPAFIDSAKPLDDGPYRR